MLTTIVSEVLLGLLSRVTNISRRASVATVGAQYIAMQI
jgi:hypothetical protein